MHFCLTASSKRSVHRVVRSPSSRLHLRVRPQGITACLAIRAPSDRTQTLSEFRRRCEAFIRLVFAKQFNAMMSPRHGTKRHARFSGGFGVPNLISHINGARQTGLPEDAPNLGRFAKQR